MATDVETWRRALLAAVEAARTPAALLVAVSFAESLRPWLEADQRAIGGDHGLTLIRGEALARFVREQTGHTLLSSATENSKYVFFLKKA